MSDASSLIDAVRRPEYTGSNRCLPCTVVNGLIALVAASIATITVSIGVGTAVLAACGAAIYLRGYLIPGTPTLTKRYLPGRIHRLFGTHHVEPAGGGVTADPSVGTERHDAEGGYTNAGEALQDEGVVTECSEADDLCLDPEFRDAWRHRIAGLREGGTGVDRLAAHLDVDPQALALEDRESEYAVTYHGDRVDGWPSRAAFLADMGVEPTLSEWCSGWESYDPELRTQIIGSLRAFLERCPACDAALEASESAWESCCREGTDVTVSCNACGDVVFNGRY
ncbi:hypothetical protein [Halorubrum sp. DTA46]|uniref:hypothetical protein n=1 Tax=Halorubrum sp. DTA46 TaxID=3402162 RepID=UPI003AADA056